MRRVVLLAVVAAAILAPATVASASHHAAGKIVLALVPLQKAQLGAVGKSFALDYGSGSTFVPDDGIKAFDIRREMQDVSLAPFGIPRYTLDYGDAFAGGTGVTEIRTSVEEYKTPAAAKAGYHRWREADTTLRAYKPGGPWHRIDVPAVGSRNFAYLGSWTAPNLNPIVGLDEQALAGRFVLDVSVFGGSVDATEHAAPILARRLHNRLRSMLKGHLAGKPVKLPRKPKPGQAADGPDLSAMILHPSDVGQATAPVVQQQYVVGLPADSAYDMEMTPAGLYDDGLDQNILWWPTATEATYAEAYLRAFFGTGSPVDLTAVGDNATGSIFDGGTDGALVIVTLANGRAGEYIVGSTTGAGPAPTASDVQSLAQAAATRLDAGLGP